MWTTSTTTANAAQERRRTPLGVRLAFSILALTCGAVALAQPIYRSQNSDGTWSYSDASGELDGASAIAIAPTSAAEPSVRLHEGRSGDAVVLLAENTFFGPVQIAVHLLGTDAIAIELPEQRLHVLPPRSTTELMRLRPAAVAALGRLDYRFQFLPGDPDARHAPEQPYRLPYAVASRQLVSQAYPERITHEDPSSRHAIDFAMPVGTGVFAARTGIVVEVARDYFGSSDSAENAGANLIRVLHDDGTMSLYAHLRLNSIRVVPGERIARGQYIADSGNTGFSTGPHLHFVVQRNRGGAIVSVPIQFAGRNGAAITVASGDEPTAY